MINFIIADWNVLNGTTWWVPSSPCQENEPLENMAECFQLKRTSFVLFYPAPYTRRPSCRYPSYQERGNLLQPFTFQRTSGNHRQQAPLCCLAYHRTRSRVNLLRMHTWLLLYIILFDRISIMNGISLRVSHHTLLSWFSSSNRTFLHIFKFDLSVETIWAIFETNLKFTINLLNNLTS